MAATLSDIVASLDDATLVGDPTVSAADVTHDSQAVADGSVFVAIRGERFDGHTFVEDASRAGAAAVIVDHSMDVDVPQIVVNDTRRTMAAAAAVVHGYPDQAMSVLGVTGTNGKTTVAHLCEAVWNHLGRPNAIVGTLGARINGEPVPITRTTPEASDLHRLLGDMRDRGVENVVMEVSSHAMDLHRVDAIRFRATGFTNLSQDHLDFHGDMESYYQSKRGLFVSYRSDCAVINIGDSWGRRLASEIEIPAFTVSTIGPADVRAGTISMASDGSVFEVLTESERATVRLPLVGSFNVENAMVAIGMLRTAGVDLGDIVEGLASAQPVRGRMEVVPHDGNFTVIVDYAHTPDAVSAALSAVREVADGVVVALVGAAGDRDAGKRSLMGASASRFADRTIVTTDNPRSEDPVEIAEEVARGASANPRGTVETIVDRRSAIKEAITSASEGDVVVILGKGHEQGQEVHGQILPFDDVQVAKEILSEVPDA